MKADKDFSPISPGETRDLAFDYRHDVFPLDPTEVLSSAVFTLEIDATDSGSTVDATPASRLSGGATIEDNLHGETDMAAVQRVTGCIAGNTYIVKCVATTSRGQLLELFAKMKCQVAT